MATVEITEQTVLSGAGKEAFRLGRSLADRGAVDAVRVDGTRVDARVGDLPVALRITRTGLAADCAHPGCADPAAELCEHAVAVALTWLGSGAKRPEPDLVAVLRTKDPGWLAARLAGLAADDPALTARLLEEAGGPDAIDVHTLREDLQAAVAEMTAERTDGYYDEWYPDTEELEEVLDDIEDLLELAPGAVADLTEHAIRLLEDVLDEGCYGDDLSASLTRAGDLHLDACRAGALDPFALAERLLTGALRGDWGAYADLTEYADVLGPEGMNRYAELLEKEIATLGRNASPPVRLRELREALARAQGGTDAVVDLLAGTAARPHDFARIADVLIRDGREDDALTWINRGLSGDTGNPRLLSLAVDCHRSVGRHVDALQVLWTRFATAPSMQTYLDLTEEAGPDATWRTRALDLLRNRTADHAGLLVQILLRQDDVPAAWDIVQTHPVSHELRMRVVETHGRTHPEAVIHVYRELAETSVQRGSRPGYQDAIRYLTAARNLAGRCGREGEFSEFLTRLRAAHPGKKALQQLLDRAGHRIGAAD